MYRGFSSCWIWEASEMRDERFHADFAAEWVAVHRKLTALEERISDLEALVVTQPKEVEESCSTVKA